MAKKSFLENIELQRLKKENTSLHNKLGYAGSEKTDLRKKVDDLEKVLTDAPDTRKETRIKYGNVKLINNIREELDYEVIKELALSIQAKGQLQPVLLTADNYLVAGYRRFNSVRLLNEPNSELKALIKKTGKNVPDYLIAYNLDVKLDQLSSEEIDELQFIENEERRSLDNFDISRLFYKYEALGFKQEEIAKKFGKTKGFVSSLISLKKIDPELVGWLKEFQVYAWSKKKFIAMNLENISENDNDFYHKNRGIIGWSSLYRLATQGSIEKQKEMFLREYGERLQKEEVASGYFSEQNKAEKNFLPEKAISRALKQSSNLKKTLLEIIENSGSKDSDVVKDLMSYLEKLESLFGKLKN